MPERRCPICGSTLEAADHLSELVGFRSFDLTQGDKAFATPSADPHRSVGRVRKAMSARDAALTPGGLDANRWLDDGGRFSSEAVARWSPPKK